MINREERLVTEEINRLVPILGKDTATRLGRAYLLGDETVRERIFELLDVVKAAVLSREDLADSALMEPPPKAVAGEGEIFIGNVLYGKKEMYPLLLKKGSFLTHIGIFGSSGYGKTNIAHSMIKQLSEGNVPIIIFDFSKRNYRDLLSTGLKGKIDVYTVGKNISPIKFNPLKPPEGVPLSQWMKEFSSIFDHAYWLLGGGRHVILKAMDSVFKGKQNPRLSDLKEWLEKYGGTNMPARERNWLATAERPLESLCFKELGEVFECDDGISPSDFFSPGKITILELDTLDGSDKTFFIEIMLQWIRDWMLVSGNREVLKGVIILEEAHHVLNREKAKKLGSETVIDLIFREIRELGLGMIYIDQHPSLVSYPALGNTSNHIYMNLGLDTQHSSDIQDASSMLGLNYDEQGCYLRKLPVGDGFMLCRNSVFPNPFTVRFPSFPITKGKVTDEMVAGLMRSRNPFPKTSSHTKPQPVKTQSHEEDLEGAMKMLQANEWEIIRILGTGQATFASQIYRIANVSGTIFKKRAQRLMEKGIVGIRHAKIRKNRLNYYYLTQLGESVYRKAFSPKEEKERIDIDAIAGNLAADGWKCSAQGEVLSIRKGEQNLPIHLKSTTASRDIMRAGETFFLCSSERIKNLVIQRAARLSADAGNPFTIFISTSRDFEQSGDLEEIEFIA